MPFDLESDGIFQWGSMLIDKSLSIIESLGELIEGITKLIEGWPELIESIPELKNSRHLISPGDFSSYIYRSLFRISAFPFHRQYLVQSFRTDPVFYLAEPL